MKYKVILPFGEYRIGQIVDDSDRYIRRKIAEGGCLEVIQEKAVDPAREKKVMPGNYEKKGGGK